MNYFTHAINFIDRPYFMAGTAVPDWLSVADRKVRLRPKILEPWLESYDMIQSQIVAGALQHLQDDDWFHATRGFVEVTGELTQMFRTHLGGDERYHCGFMGHVGMELLLDGILIEMYPQRFDAYWIGLQSVDAVLIETVINRVAKVPTDRLAWFIELFRREQFLRSYVDDDSLLFRLNQVLQRVRLSPIPAYACAVVKQGRELVRNRLLDLLPPDKFSLP